MVKKKRINYTVAIEFTFEKKKTEIGESHPSNVETHDICSAANHLNTPAFMQQHYRIKECITIEFVFIFYVSVGVWCLLCAV